MARSTFYYHLKQLKFPDKYKQEKNEIVSIYHDHKGRYGYRRITVEMHNRGYSINHKTVLRLMNECGVKCQVRLKKYRSYKGEVGAVVPDLLKRNFMAERPNQKWVTDLTEFSLFGKKLYLSPIMDLYNREIISYNIAEHPTFYQTMKMLEDAIKDLPDTPELILHSDQGWQYQMKRYQYRLREKGISQSMSRKGNCLDNAVMENFFGLLKSELLYLQKFESVDHFRKELEEYINYYNNKRIKTALNNMSPVQYMGALHALPALDPSGADAAQLSGKTIRKHPLLARKGRMSLRGNHRQTAKGRHPHRSRRQKRLPHRQASGAHGVSRRHGPAGIQPAAHVQTHLHLHPEKRPRLQIHGFFAQQKRNAAPQENHGKI